MAKNISKLRKENDQLKTQVAGFGKELEEIQSRLATFSCETDKDLEKSVQYLSDDYDSFKTSREEIEAQIQSMSSRLIAIEERVQKIDEYIEDAMKYSYQYNVKIIGFEQKNRIESAQDTIEFCLSLFKELGAKVTEYDIDIAHRVPSRNSSSCPNCRGSWVVGTKSWVVGTKSWVVGTKSWVQNF